MQRRKEAPEKGGHMKKGARLHSKESHKKRGLRSRCLGVESFS